MVIVLKFLYEIGSELFDTLTLFLKGYFQKDNFEKNKQKTKKQAPFFRELSRSVVECLTGDQRAVGSSLTGVTALWSLSKTHLS